MRRRRSLRRGAEARERIREGAAAAGARPPAGGVDARPGKSANGSTAPAPPAAAAASTRIA